MRQIHILLVLCVAAVLAPAGAAQTADLYDVETVRDFKLTFSQPNWWNDLWINYQTETMMEADLEVDGTLYPSVGIRFKGNSSASHVWPAEKMPFKIHTDEYVPDQDLYGYDNINLGNSYRDPTFVREVAVYEVLRRFMPAPQANYVRLWLNGQYWGIYINVQQIDGDFIDEWYSDEDGNRYKAVHGSLEWLGSNPVTYQAEYELHSDGNGNEWTDLIDMIDELNNGNPQAFDVNLEPVLNIDQALRYLAACNLLGNLDSYLSPGHNYYLYTHYDRFDILPWDWNMCFAQFRKGSGGGNLTITQIQELDPYYGMNSQHPLIEELLSSNSAEGPERYMAHHRALFAAEFDWAVMEPRILSLQTLIEQDIINDPKRLYSLQHFYDNVYQDVTTTGTDVFLSAGLKPFVENRRTFLLNHAEYAKPEILIDQVASDPAVPSSSDEVAVTAALSVTTGSVSSADVMFRSGGAGPFTASTMYDDGLHGDGAAGDGVWGATLPARPAATLVEYYVAARTTGVRKHAPVEAEFAPFDYRVSAEGSSSPVLLNEFLAKNDTVNSDEMNEYEDWVEIYNKSAASIDLGGAYLTDNLNSLTKWQIPAGTSIAPMGTLLIWTDDDPTDGPLHATFKLDADGEEIALVHSDGTTVLDFVVFGPQEADITTGRLFDGQEPWVTFPAPTPDTQNAPGTSGYRIYSALDKTANTLSFGATGTPVLNAPVTFEVGNGPLNDWVALPFSWDAYSTTLGSGAVLLVSWPSFWMPNLQTDGTGAAGLNMTLPGNPFFIGLPVYAQCLTNGNGTLEASNALEIIIGP
jgi:hypothetical protein